MESSLQLPWYVAGLAFECTGCGRCCAGPEPGYVWVNNAEAAAIARHLGIGEAEMRRRYVRRVGSRESLVERRDNHNCIFLCPRPEGGKHCAIYEVRPRQCRTWPFWPANLRSTAAWSIAGQRCEGINRGNVFLVAEIEQRRDATES